MIDNLGGGGMGGGSKTLSLSGITENVKKKKKKRHDN